MQGWGATSIEPRKHHIYTGLANIIGILLETPLNAHRVMRDGTLKEIPQEERYYHQVRGQYVAQSTIIRAAAEQRTAIRAMTTRARMRAIQAGTTGGDPVMLKYELTNQGNETIWLPDPNAPMGLALKNAPIWLKYNITRTTPRPVGYLMPPSMAAALPILLGQQTDLHLTPAIAAFPIANVAMMVRDALNGVFLWPLIAQTLAVNLALVVLFLWVARRVLAFEDFLMGSFDGSFWRFLKDRILARKNTRPLAAEAARHA